MIELISIISLELLYLPILTKMNFDDAQAHCKTLGGSLLIANSSEEHDLGREAIFRNLNDRYEHNYYIGLKMRKGPLGTRKWEWIDGSPTSWLNFGPSSGDGSTDEDYCAAMTTENWGLVWYDVPCSNKERFICKFVNDPSHS